MHLTFQVNKFHGPILPNLVPNLRVSWPRSLLLPKVGPAAVLPVTVAHNIDVKLLCATTGSPNIVGCPNFPSVLVPLNPVIQVQV